ncbi:MAG: NUDIX domain-containing protein [Candidatus Pacearchaeota archaeon]|nr:NUDIX domain-containing protein [Candidatus Pacearchaeota archaeon]
MKEEKGINDFQVIVLGIIFNPKERKILVGKRENDPYFPKLKWTFPGGRLTPDGEINKSLKERIKAQTGLDVKNLGAVFSKTYEEKRNLLAIYFLCEAVKGKPKAGEKLKTLKWVRAVELEKLFATSFHPRLREYLHHIG